MNGAILWEILWEHLPGYPLGPAPTLEINAGMDHPAPTTSARRPHFGS
jgi:hypothetical protein